MLRAIAITLASWCALVQGAHAATALLPVQAAAMGTDAARMSKAAQALAREVLGARLIEIDEATFAQLPGGVAGCVSDPDCIERVAQVIIADEVAVLVIEPAGPDAPTAFAKATLTTFGFDGKPTFSAIQPLSGDADLKGLFMRGFAPQRYVGRLDVTGIGDGDIVLIDGLPGAASSLVRPGGHDVLVVHTDGRQTRLHVEVPFDGLATAALPPPVSARGGPPLVPIAATASVACVGAAVAVIAAIQWATAADLVARSTALGTRCGASAADPTGNGFVGLGVGDAVGRSEGACLAANLRARHEQLAFHDAAATATAVGAALVAVGAAGLAGTLLTWETP